MKKSKSTSNTANVFIVQISFKIFFNKNTFKTLAPMFNEIQLITHPQKGSNLTENLLFNCPNIVFSCKNKYKMGLQ